MFAKHQVKITSTSIVTMIPVQVSIGTVYFSMMFYLLQLWIKDSTNCLLAIIRNQLLGQVAWN